MNGSDRPIRVLLIEGDSGAAEVVLNELSRTREPKFETIHARRLEDGLGALGAEAFDVVLLELRPRSKDGRSAIESVRSAAPAAATIVRTEIAGEEDVIDALERGAHEHVSKHADGVELISCIRRALARRRGDSRSELMAAIVSASADTILAVDREGIITSFNAGAERLLGYSAADAIGKPISMIASGEQAIEQERWYHDLLAGGMIHDQWTTRIRADGSTVEVAVTSSPIYDREGEVVGICSMMREVTGLVGFRANLERQEELLLATQSAARVGSWEYEIGSGQLRWSDEMYRLWGWDPMRGPITGPEVLENIHPDDRDALMADARRWVESPGAALNREYRLVTESGEVRTLLARGLHVPGADGRPGRLLGTAHDISEEREREATEVRAQRQLQQSFEAAPAPMWITDVDGTLDEVNDALCELIGQSREHLIGRKIYDFMHPEERDGTIATMRVLLSGERASVTREKRFLHRDGHVIWVIVGITLIRQADGEPSHVIGQAQDITSRRRYEERLRHMADHDPLTGLLNRRGFDRELRRHVSHIIRYGATGALMIIDLDNFKQFNDTHGHTAGDNLIAQIARGLHSRLRANDVIGRIGGDEFAVLLPEADRGQAEIVARALVEYVRESPAVASIGSDLPLTTSVGIYTFDGEGPFSKDRAMIAADLAMYEAKGTGRDRWAHYVPRTGQPVPDD